MATHSDASPVDNKQKPGDKIDLLAMCFFPFLCTKSISTVSNTGLHEHTMQANLKKIEYLNAKKTQILLFIHLLNK